MALDEAKEKQWVRGAMGSKKHAYRPLGPKVFRWNKQFRQLQRQQCSQRQSEKRRQLLGNYWAREPADGSKERKRGQMSMGVWTRLVRGPACPCENDVGVRTFTSDWRKQGPEVWSGTSALTALLFDICFLWKENGHWIGKSSINNSPKEMKTKTGSEIQLLERSSSLFV